MTLPTQPHYITRADAIRAAIAGEAKALLFGFAWFGTTEGTEYWAQAYRSGHITIRGKYRLRAQLAKYRREMRHGLKITNKSYVLMFNGQAGFGNAH